MAVAAGLALGLAGVLAACDGDLNLGGSGAVESADASCIPDPPAAYCETDQTLFRQPFAETGPEAAEAFLRGSKVFNAQWQTASLGTADFDGLGPEFDNTSCTSCHIFNGRGHPPDSDGALTDSMVVRLSVPGTRPDGSPVPDPVYGYQLNQSSVAGVQPEGKVSVTYELIEGTYADGDRYQLRKPIYKAADLAFGPLGEGAMLSPRVAPPAYGMGLLEAVDPETILALADPDDANGDGISGRANMVHVPDSDTERLGRFGWKATTPDLRHQIAGALSADVGITSTLFPEDNCPTHEERCKEAPNGGTPEITDAQLQDIVRYVQLVSVTPRKSDHPAVRRGRALFQQIGCAGCHVPSLKTSQQAALPEVAGRVIHPYTDLLLHDMGDSLADNRPEFSAEPHEWRTAPLWYVGLTETVSGHTYFLHDGRARSLAEAILWHGGEAQAARDAFVNLPRDSRYDLIRFLEIL
jgi:CxxC motif-containing protein (DUF1111 family)